MKLARREEGCEGVDVRRAKERERGEEQEANERDVAGSSSGDGELRYTSPRRQLLLAEWNSVCGTSERNPTRQTRLHLTEWNLSTLASTSNKIQIRRGSAGDPPAALLLPDQFKPLAVQHLRLSDSSLSRKERRVSIGRNAEILNKRRVRTSETKLLRVPRGA